MPSGQNFVSPSEFLDELPVLPYPSSLPSLPLMSDGCYKNLINQIDAIYRHCNRCSYKTRVRYYEATQRFCKFLSEKFRLQKFKNVEDRHFRAYVEYLKETGAAPATIQADLAGIRFFHRESGSKNKLSENDALDLPKREIGTENRAWLPEEIEKAKHLAEKMGRTDVVIAIECISAFGLRLEEFCTIKVEYLMSAKRTGQLVVPKGKGGQRRAITLNTEQKSLIDKYLDYAKAAGLYPGNYLVSESEKHGVKQEMKSLQNWMSHNREKFMDLNRTALCEDGKKKRHNTIYWHGLRHSYAQKTYDEALKEKPDQAKKIVSENLGHHRLGITKIYLAENPTNKNPN